MSFRTGLDPVRIGNMALSNIGARSTISSLNENSPEAQQIKLWYDWSRVETLQAYNWGFARKRADLVEATDLPPQGVWGFRYADLTDMLTIRYINNPLGLDADAVPFEIEQDSNGLKTIVTDMEDAIAVYTADVENTQIFPPLFVDALAAILASHIAISLTGNIQIKTAMEQTFLLLVGKASAADANERVDQKPRDPETIRGRA